MKRHARSLGRTNRQRPKVHAAFIDAPMKLENVLRRIHSNSDNLFHGRPPCLRFATTSVWHIDAVWGPSITSGRPSGSRSWPEPRIIRGSVCQVEASSYRTDSSDLGHVVTGNQAIDEIMRLDDKLKMPGEEIVDIRGARGAGWGVLPIPESVSRLSRQMDFSGKSRQQFIG